MHDGGAVWRHGDIDNRSGKVNAVIPLEDGCEEDGGSVEHVDLLVVVDDAPVPTRRALRARRIAAHSAGESRASLVADLRTGLAWWWQRRGSMRLPGRGPA